MIALTLVALAIASKPPVFPAVDQLGLGPGAITCKQYLEETPERDQRDYWVIGFWSGANAAFGLRVGDHTSSPDIFTEVEKVCRENPTENLAPAVQDAYLRVAHRGG